MSKVKCGNCAKFIDKETARKVSIQNFCPDCWPKKPERKTKKRPDISSSLRQEVLEADAGRCRFCGTRSGLHLHHIKYRSSGGAHERGNLITLCVACHQEVHSDKKKYQPLCFAVVEERDSKGDKMLLIRHLGKEQK